MILQVPGAHGRRGHRLEAAGAKIANPPVGQIGGDLGRAPEQLGLDRVHRQYHAVVGAVGCLVSGLLQQLLRRRAIAVDAQALCRERELVQTCCDTRLRGAGDAGIGKILRPLPRLGGRVVGMSEP